MTYKRRITDTTNDLLIDVIEKLDHIATANLTQQQISAARPLECLRQTASAQTPDTTPSKDSYTIGQIAAGMLALVSVVGPLIGVWINLNNQISTQKVTYDSTIEQIKTDINGQREVDKETLKSMKELTQRLEQLDSSVDQIYNRLSTK